MDRTLHKRYLDYRETFVYFGRNMVLMSAAEFKLADEELRTLDAKGRKRDETEEARKIELDRVLFRS